MTETQAIYSFNSKASSQFGSEIQNQGIALGCSNSAAPTPIPQRIDFGTLSCESVASKGAYQVLDGNIKCGHIFMTDEGTWKNSAGQGIYATPYQAAAGLFEAPSKPISIPKLLEKPFDELIPFHFKIDTNRQQGSSGAGEQRRKN